MSVPSRADRGLRFDHQVLAQRVLFGTGEAVQNAVKAARDLRANRVFLIGSPSTQALTDELSEFLPLVGRIREVIQHVPAELASDATRAAVEAHADLVISVGGGSAIGLAKMIARETQLPIVAIPTTLSGSEATRMWGVTVDGHKHTGLDTAVLPQVVIYDTALLGSLPPPMLAASGMNAIAHAIDGFWAPGADPITDALGIEGLRAIIPGLRSLAFDPQDVAAREATLYGAYMVATSFASTGSGLHHKICHVLGGTFNMPHAQTHAVVISHVASMNFPAFPDIADRLAPVLGADVGAGLWALNRELGGPGSLAELGFRESDIPRAVELILPVVPQSNPGTLSPEELETLLRGAWQGLAPQELRKS